MDGEEIDLRSHLANIAIFSWTYGPDVGGLKA